MSPLRALQYSSALDTYPVIKVTELNKSNNRFLTRTDKVKSRTPFQEIGKNIMDKFKSQSPSKYYFNYEKPVISPTTIKLPDPRYTGINPITGENRSVSKNPFHLSYVEKNNPWKANSIY